MQKFYDKPDIYDLNESEEYLEVMKKHWERVLRNKKITSLLDVSIGTGGVTLPLAELGIRLYGSDLSDKMLAKCRTKALTRKTEIELQLSDFREITQTYSGRHFDCVASTGNSLPYVTNADIIKTLEQMDSLVQSGGYLYIDTRNWDKILQERPRFYLYNPMFDCDTRINMLQVWDYNNDGTMTFNILYTFEKDGKIFRKEQFEEHYFPVRQKLFIDTFSRLGYENIEVLPFPAILKSKDPTDYDWYSIIAQKK